ncbi:MAG: helix-turn-helix domain-containing protein [Xenococcaceae cyanobacterium MO_207.B15]|nr:helix-turn-helix domain-containing protein [Xenococcaceae cyanobacterium MO_207.B15]
MSKSLRGDYSLKQIDKLYKNCKLRTLKTRLLAIKLVYSKWKVTEVAEYISVSHKTIYNWIDLWNEGGIEKLKPQVRGKRKKAYIDKKEWLVILEEIKGKGYNLSQVRDYIEQTRGIKYSYKGVWNVLRRWLKIPYGKPYVLIEKQSPTAS